MINFTITFSRTHNNNTTTVTAFSKATTHKGAILDARLQARRADARLGVSAIHGDFVASPAIPTL